MNDTITADLRSRLAQHKSALGRLPDSDVEFGKLLVDQIDNHAASYTQFFNWLYKRVEIPGDTARRWMDEARKVAEIEEAENQNQN